MSAPQTIRDVRDVHGDHARILVIGQRVVVEQFTEHDETAMVYTAAQAREVATALLVAAEAAEVTS